MTCRVSLPEDKNVVSGPVINLKKKKKKYIYIYIYICELMLKGYKVTYLGTRGIRNAINCLVSL